MMCVKKFWIIFYVVGRQLRAQQHLPLILPLGSLRLLLPHPLDPIYVIIHCKGLQKLIQNFRQLLDRHT